MLDLACTNWLQVVPCGGGRNLLSMEIDGTWGRMLILILTSNFVKHRHVMVLVLHAGPGLTLLVKLLLVADSAGLRPDIFLRFARLDLRAGNLRIVLTRIVHQVLGGALNFLALAHVGVSRV